MKQKERDFSRWMTQLEEVVRGAKLLKLSNHEIHKHLNQLLGSIVTGSL